MGQPAEVTTLKPGADYLTLLNLNQSMGEELAATRKALTAAHRRATRLQKQLNDERGLGADEEVIHKVLVFWRDRTGRPASTRIDLTTRRAQRVRWALKHWEPREVCLMVVGLLREADQWHVKHGRTDITHVLKDEVLAERFLRVGRRVVGS